MADTQTHALAAAACADSSDAGRRIRTDALAELQRLQALSNTDPEAAHGAADDVLLDLINDPEITDAFSAIRKWYG